MLIDVLLSTGHGDRTARSWKGLVGVGVGSARGHDRPTARGSAGRADRVGNAASAMAAKVALGIVTVLLISAAASQMYLTSYEPLDAHSTGSSGVSPFRLVVQQFDAFGSEGSFRQYTVHARPGTQVIVQFPLWNYGHIPVRVEGLDPGTYPSENATEYRLLGTRSMLGRQTSYPSTPFSPFTLGPGEGIQMFLGITLEPHDWARGRGSL
jgi:hypothetical protein